MLHVLAGGHGDPPLVATRAHHPGAGHGRGLSQVLCYQQGEDHQYVVVLMTILT